MSEILNNTQLTMNRSLIDRLSSSPNIQILHLIRGVCIASADSTNLFKSRKYLSNPKIFTQPNDYTTPLLHHRLTNNDLLHHHLTNNPQQHSKLKKKNNWKHNGQLSNLHCYFLIFNTNKHHSITSNLQI